MEFMSERTAITILSDIIVKCSVSLFNAVKYIYSIAEDDFYNCNIKDVLKVTINNITDTNCLSALGLRINNDKCKEMNTAEYNNVLSLTVYSFAVRIPTLKSIECDGQTLRDDQIKALYDTVISKGAKNYKNTIEESFDEIKKLVKQKKPIPPYSADWYKTFILTQTAELSEIKNKNIFLLGAVDILFTMFYACLEDELQTAIKSMDKL